MMEINWQEMYGDRREPIFTITGMSEKRGRRCFGFAHTLEDAQRWIANDIGGMHEQIYDHLVVEDTVPGIHPSTKVSAWYGWSDEGWAPCERPAYLRPNIVNFGIG